MRIILLFLTILLILTPGTAFAATIKINEFYAAGSTTSNPDWIEIYKDGVDISLYQLIDTINNKKDLVGATCNGNFCTIDWYNYLNNSGDTIRLVLKSATDSPLDQVTYGSNGDISIPNTGQSVARNPDATGDWIITSSPTKGEPNSFSTSEPSQTPTPTPSSTSTATPTSTPQSSSSFTISNIPTQINSDQSFKVSVNLTLPNNRNTDYYLSGAFKKTDGTRYFGLTKISSNWVKYESSNYLNQYKITTDESGNWTGILEVKPDTADSDYKGSGDYVFKVGRYTTSGSGPTWSNNESTIKIISTESDKQDGTSTNNPSSTTNPSTSPSSVKTKTTTSSQVKNYDRLVYHTASIAGATASATASASSTPSAVKNQKQTNPIIWVGLIFIFAGASTLGYIYLRKNAKIHIPFGK